MVELEIDGQKVEVLEGSMVMDAANKLGVYVPHFCYHKKLSIAANCRMCLVQVEKAPKPLPACATPVTAGMKVFTASEQAKKAQAGVMEFLLINHPLDCPICDQGGECQLQDLAVGYGGSGSRYQEEKRVVFHKNVGPLVSMEEMTRCIHCTRCVRFGQEIAGVMELGMLGRGEHSEITSFVGKTVDSELSGNMIDICPVGALTSKPFRYSARTWELSRRKSVSPHDSLGANLVVQVKNNKVMRVVPLENEDVNECWISDKDRFSYEALNSDQRLTAPMIKQGGEWKTTDWQTALEYVAHGLTDIKARHGAGAIGTLVSPHATLEEMHLAQRFTRALGSENIDHRLRQSDFSGDHAMGGAPWLGMPVADVPKLDRVLVIGSFFRKDHPLLAQRVRQLAKKKGNQVSMIHAVDDDWLMNVRNKLIVAPAQIVAALDAVLAALGDGAADDNAKAIADSLSSGNNVALWIGNLAAQSADAAQIHARVQAIAHRLAALKGEAQVRFGFLGEAANSVGGHIARVLPGEGGRNARQMFEQPLKAYVLLHAEPAFDTAYPAQAVKALGEAEMVVVMSPFMHSMDVADVLLPIAPFTETAGTFINTEGRAQTFNGVVRPLGDTRPAWKVLRVLGNLMEFAGFDQDTPEDVRAECLPADLEHKLNNHTEVSVAAAAAAPAGYQRIADVPIYFADPLVRRAASLQLTADARAPRAWLRGDEMHKLGIAEGAQVKVRNGAGEVLLAAARDDRLPAGCVRVAGAHAATINAGPLAGGLSVERA